MDPGGSTAAVAATIGDRTDRRFVAGEELGAGAMGTVVRAHDRVRRQDVALKYLRNVHPDGLYRFKQEFRLLAELVHPNLVTLYELVGDGDRWAVAMELVVGARSVLDFVRPFEHLRHRHSALATGGTQGAVPPSSTGADEGPTLAPGEEGSSCSGAVVAETAALDVGATEATSVLSVTAAADPRRNAIAEATLLPERLREVLRQLLNGLDHVHRRQLLHRDIKPSNVLVDRTGRVVICDFGLVVAAGASEAGIFGTPSYMSPEQARGAPLSPASDLYSVGVLLYEALTGHLPARGSRFSELIAAKEQMDFPDVLSHAPDADPRLAELCMALLRPEPAERPDAETILAQLADGQGRSTSQLATVSAVERSQLVGREVELGRLRAALHETRSGSTVAVVVAGPSGVGKSALVSAMCEEVRATDGAVVLAGRCYQTESVPFKALDAVVDELATYLRTMSPEMARRCIPGDIGSLAQLFPVLRMAPAVAEAIARGAEVAADHLLRPRAQQALRDLLTTLAGIHPLVIVVDDVQWSDLDSEPFLRAMVEAADSPGMLLIATYRDDGGRPALLSDQETVNGDIRQLTLQPLADEAAISLVESIAGADVEPDVVRRIVTDAGGNPLFVAELAHAVRTGRSTSAEADLDALLLERIDDLPGGCQKLLEAAALTAWPQPLSMLSRALELDSEAAVLAQLRAARLIRIVAGRDGERITTYHDRVRECVADRLSPRQRRRLHRKLARAFESAPELDFEALAAHWRGAEDQTRAVHYTLRAAERALSSRAYRRAADHYRRVLDAEAVLSAEQRATAAMARADALFLAGSVREAAEAYLDEARRCPPDVATGLRSQALICLLRAQDLTAAERVAHDAGQAAGLTFPTPRRALASIIWGRLRLPRQVGRLRPSSDVPARERIRLDVARDASGALGLTNPFLGFAVHTRYLYDALDVGDAWHVCNAMSQEASFLSAARGAQANRAIARALREARRAAEVVADDGARALVDGYEGMTLFLKLIDFSDAADAMLGALPELESASELTWMADVMRQFGMQSLAVCGRFRDLGAALGPVLEGARSAGNDWLRDNVSREAGVYAYLAADRPEDAFAHNREPAPCTDRLPMDTWFHHCFRAETEVYTGQLSSAVERIERLWQRMRRFARSTVPSGRCWTMYVRSRIHVALLTAGADRSIHLPRLRETCAALRRERKTTPEASAACEALLRAMVAHVQGDRDEVVAHLRVVIERTQQMQSWLIQIPAKHVLGQVLGGDEGAALRAEAEQWLTQERIGAPMRFVRWVVPIDPEA